MCVTHGGGGYLLGMDPRWTIGGVPHGIQALLHPAI